MREDNGVAGDLRPHQRADAERERCSRLEGSGGTTTDGRSAEKDLATAQRKRDKKEEANKQQEELEKQEKVRI